jgi:hypothetical protein
MSAATMATLIEQIQRDCVDNTASVSALLRKVKLAATKLGVPQVESWVNNELNGYSETLPDYRIVHGTPMARCPDTGTHPLLLGPGVEWLCKKGVGESIASLEHCLASGSNELMISFPASITSELNKANGSRASYYLSISANQLVRIIDRVRTLILDWAAKLEKAGVVGTDFSFSEGDKQKAATMQINIGSVENFTGNLGQGNVSGSIVSNAGLDVEAVRALVRELRKYGTELTRAGADATSLDARIAAIEAELQKAAPDASKLRGFLSDVRNAVSGAAGNIIASGVLYKIGGLLGA